MLKQQKPHVQPYGIRGVWWPVEISGDKVVLVQRSWIVTENGKPVGKTLKEDLELKSANVIVGWQPRRRDLSESKIGDPDQH